MALLLLRLIKGLPILLMAQLQLAPIVCVNLQLLQLTLVIFVLYAMTLSLLILSKYLVKPSRILSRLFAAILLLIQGQGHQLNLKKNLIQNVR